jgi:hypothetical protein
MLARLPVLRPAKGSRDRTNGSETGPATGPRTERTAVSVTTARFGAPFAFQHSSNNHHRDRRMAHHDDAWLRHRQQRFMRPDAARYLRPDAARFLKPGTDPASVYPALERKYPGQPRLPGGSTGGGRFTFGRRAGDGTSAPSEGQPVDGIDAGEMLPTIDVVADPTPSSGPDFWSGFWSDLDSLIGSIGDIQGGPDDSPPKIPAKRPSRSSKRTSVVRAVSNFLAKNAGILADVFLGIVRG